MHSANPINVRLIDHVVLRVNDLETMVAFYTDVLGLKLERGPGRYGLAQLRAGRSLIDLVDVAGPSGGNPPDRRAQNVDHVCLQVEPWDADALRLHLGKHGVEVGEIESRYGAQGQGPSIYISDPEGNTIELKGAGGRHHQAS